MALRPASETPPDPTQVHNGAEGKGRGDVYGWKGVDYALGDQWCADLLGACL